MLGIVHRPVKMIRGGGGTGKSAPPAADRDTEEQPPALVQFYLAPPPDARTIARMPALSAAGSVGQASASRAKSGSVFPNVFPTLFPSPAAGFVSLVLPALCVDA